MTTPTMTIDGVEYVEAQFVGSLGVFDGCEGCWFELDDEKCCASRKLAREAFGGKCWERGVIYLRKE